MPNSSNIKTKKQTELTKKYKMNNILFKIITLFFILLLFLLVTFAILSVINKGFGGIIESLQTEEIRYSLKLSLITSIISTSMCILFAIPIAYGIERYNLFGRRILNIILDIPLALPPVVSGVALLLLFGQTSFGKFLAENGLKFVFSIKGIVLAQFFVNVPYMIRILKSTIRDINPELEFVQEFRHFSKLLSLLQKMVCLLELL